MCGIAGIFLRGDAPIDRARLLAMRDDQVHRGPDAVGLRIGEHIGLAFNRLAILDLSPAANQPMCSEDDSVWIVFNGEIYNFPDLRRDLESHGRRFRTRSDTEVILQGFEQWGLDVIPRLNGMFALGIWDARRERLHLARDRVGEKPLIYRDAGGEVAFASEIRALVKGLGSTPEIDPQVLDEYLAYLCVPGNRSIFQGIEKVPPACIVTCTRDSLRVERYWRLSYKTKTVARGAETLERLDEILTDATRIRMVSDVPVGAFLSGGVDSSTVVALMGRSSRPTHTFSIGFSEASFDELPHAREVATACGTRHQEFRVEPDAAGILPRLVWHYGEPFADSSSVPTYYLAREARQQATVVLTGDGGDEAFAGYPWFRNVRVAEIYRRLIPGFLRRNALAPLGRALARVPHLPRSLGRLSRLLTMWGNRSACDAFWIWPGFTETDRATFYTPHFIDRLNHFDPKTYCREAYLRADGDDDLDRALQVGIDTYLPGDLLVKVDIATMANSLEARTPLLDYRVLEFAAQLPATTHLRGLRTKSLLKTYAERLVPASVLHRPKQGFEIPLAGWLRGPLRRPLEVLLKHPRLVGRGYFSSEAVRNTITRHLNGADEGPKLWALLWLELWFRMFIDGDLKREDSLRDLG